MKPSSVVLTPMHKRKNPYSIRKAIPRMSWTPSNIFNIWQRTSPDSPLRRDIDFNQSSKSLFQLRWASKAFLKGYHADFIRTKNFERWYVPERLPAIHVKQSADKGPSDFVEGREKAGGRTRDERFARQKKAIARAPIGTMLFTTVERRLDVCVFRALFAQSVYEARHMVIGGQVKLNGQTVRNANTLLNPGDIFSVNPKVIPFLRNPEKPDKKIVKESEEAEDVEEDVETSAEIEGDEAAKIAAAKEAEIAEQQAEIDAEKSGSSSNKDNDKKKAKNSKLQPTSFFNLPPYAQTQVFVPAYILPSYLTCSAVYVRHPTARAKYSEIASPYDAGGDILTLGWEWYKRKVPRMRQGKLNRWWNPQRTKAREQIPRGDN